MPQMTVATARRSMARRASSPAVMLLSRHCQYDSEPLNGGTLSTGQIIRTEPELHLAECSVELERHLRVVFIDDRRARILSDVKTLVQREPEGRGLIDAAFRHLFAIDSERA